MKYEKLIKSTTKCLYEAFNIDYFSYQQVSIDGGYVLLANNPEYIEYYLDNHLYQHDIFVHNPALCKNESQVFLLENDAHQKDHDLDILFSHCRPKFKINQNIIIRVKKADYYELFCFGSSCEDEHLKKICTNHIDSLKKFIPYFIKNMGHAIFDINELGLDIRKIKGGKFQLENTLDITYEISNKKFLDEVNHEGSILDKRFKSLSRREEECLYWTIQGKTAKETAYLLNISPRTVEEYRENARKKLNPALSLNSLCFLIGKYHLLEQ